MNTQYTSSTQPLRFMPGLLAALLILAMPFRAQADVDVNLNLWRGYGNFYGQITMTASSPDPVTYHRVESPNGLIWRERGPSTNSGSFANLGYTGLLDECTNGLWTLILNVGDTSATTNTFSVSLSGVASNLFGDITMVDPLYDATVSTNPPNIQWTSTSMLPSIYLYVREVNYPYTLGDSATLPGTATSWTPALPLSSTDQNLFIEYSSKNFSGITFTVPTNVVGGAAVPGWTASGDLRSYLYSDFTVAGGGGGGPLDDAVESPGLTWSTYGDADWYVSSTDYTVGGSSLQSGDLYFYDGSSTLEAMVIGPGTVSFDWALFADYGDSFEFDAYADSSEGTYDYFYYEGYETYGWDSYTVDLEPGTNWLNWSFYNGDLDENDLNAAFLDNVVYSPGTPDYEADFELNIQRLTQGTNEYYYMYPSLSYTYPEPVTTHEVSSPNGLSSSAIGSYPYDTLQALIDEIEGGDWTIHFNVDGPDNREYTFTVTVDDLTTNDLPLATILEPLYGATGVATNSGFSWMGPTSFDSLYVYVLDIGPNTTLDSSTLPVGDTSWSAGPALPEGTNSFDAYYTSNNFAGLTISEPMDYDYNYLSSWSTEVKLTTRGNSRFVTGSDFVALPVTLFPPMLMGGDLGLSFISQSGATHWVEYTTNLVTGPWMPATNFPGDGTTNLLSIPATNPAAYYRVETQ